MSSPQYIFRCEIVDAKTQKTLLRSDEVELARKATTRPAFIGDDFVEEDVESAVAYLIRSFRRNQRDYEKKEYPDSYEDFLTFNI